MNDRVAFDSRGLVPAVLQHARTAEVLMMAWMNREALRLTRETGQAHFWSRSRQTLWHKGATSGNFMNVREMRIDCDGDTLLLRVDPDGPACHTGERSCFYRRLDPDLASSRRPKEGGRPVERAEGEPQPRAASAGEQSGILDELFAVILDRERRRPTGSYTAELLDAGEDEILKKVGEEAMEVVLAAKGQGDERMVSEVADLVYHLLVLLASRGLEPADVEAELSKRRR
jgi:phosphoribosyl-ATP pyrophosphohydrolase/phosphoribosyl-AMP cyclohydrolase